MLKQCAKRACYNTLQKHDLLTALPFEDNKFDCLISVAVTTYLSKYFLKINGKAYDKTNFVHQIQAKHLASLFENLHGNIPYKLFRNFVWVNGYNENKEVDRIFFQLMIPNKKHFL